MAQGPSASGKIWLKKITHLWGRTQDLKSWPSDLNTHDFLTSTLDNVSSLLVWACCPVGSFTC